MSAYAPYQRVPDVCRSTWLGQHYLRGGKSCAARLLGRSPGEEAWEKQTVLCCQNRAKRHRIELEKKGLASISKNFKSVLDTGGILTIAEGKPETGNRLSQQK